MLYSVYSDLNPIKWTQFLVGIKKSGLSWLFSIRSRHQEVAIFIMRLCTCVVYYGLASLIGFCAKFDGFIVHFGYFVTQSEWKNPDLGKSIDRNLCVKEDNDDDDDAK